MAKYSVTVESRRLYVGPEENSVGEMFDAVAYCQFKDDAENNNDFDITHTSDSERLENVTAYDTGEEVVSNIKGAEIAGTRSNDTTFTRTAGSWTLDALIGWWAFCYVDGAEADGSWLKITDNTATAIVISGTLPASCDRIKLSARPKFRHSIQIVPQEGFWGTFFQYKVVKKIPTDGYFRWSRWEGRAIPRPGIDPEFLAGAGSNDNAWE